MNNKKIDMSHFTDDVVNYGWKAAVDNIWYQIIEIDNEIIAVRESSSYTPPTTEELLTFLQEGE